jgi:hypothetical protein
MAPTKPLVGAGNQAAAPPVPTPSQPPVAIPTPVAATAVEEGQGGEVVAATQTPPTPPHTLVQLPHQPSGYSHDTHYPNIHPHAATFNAIATYTNHITASAPGGINNNNNIRPGQQEQSYCCCQYGKGSHTSPFPSCNTHTHTHRYECRASI